MTSLPRLLHISATSALILAMTACGEKPGNPAAFQPPPPEVPVVTIAPAALTIANELPGRLESSRIAEVRARVPGIVLKRHFKEGSDV